MATSAKSGSRQLVAEKIAQTTVLEPAFQIPRVPIHWSILTAGIVAVMTTAFYFGDQNRRDTLNFFVVAAALGAGGLSAYYVWAGLRTSIDQRNSLIEDEKVKLALGFLSRWNDPSWAATRQAWYVISDELDKSPACMNQKDVDLAKRQAVTAVLNFYEEMGYAARSGAADIPTLRELFRGVLLKYMKTTRSLIEFKRRANPEAWSNFEWLCDHFKREP